MSSRSTRGRRPMPKLPIVSIVLMAIFMIGGSIGLASKWPAGPAGLDWGVWVVVYGGYVFLISAAAFYVKTGK